MSHRQNNKAHTLRTHRATGPSRNSATSSSRPPTEPPLTQVTANLSIHSPSTSADQSIASSLTLKLQSGDRLDSKTREQMKTVMKDTMESFPASQSQASVVASLYLWAMRDSQAPESFVVPYAIKREVAVGTGGKATQTETFTRRLWMRAVESGHWRGESIDRDGKVCDGKRVLTFHGDEFAGEEAGGRLVDELTDNLQSSWSRKVDCPSNRCNVTVSFS